MNGILFLQDRIVIPIGLRWLFLNKIHDAHLGSGQIETISLNTHVLAQLEQWHQETLCQECDLCRESQMIPANMPKFQVNATHPGETYGVDIAEIQGKQHHVSVCVDYISCCIFERELNSLHKTEVVKGSLSQSFCDVGAAWQDY